MKINLKSYTINDYQFYYIILVIKGTNKLTRKSNTMNKSELVAIIDQYILDANEHEDNSLTSVELFRLHDLQTYINNTDDQQRYTVTTKGAANAVSHAWENKQYADNLDDAKRWAELDRDEGVSSIEVTDETGKVVYAVEGL